MIFEVSFLRKAYASIRAFVGADSSVHSGMVNKIPAAGEDLVTSLVVTLYELLFAFWASAFEIPDFILHPKGSSQGFSASGKGFVDFGIFLWVRR